MEIRLAYGQTELTVQLDQSIKVDSFRAPESQHVIDCAGFSQEMSSADMSAVLKGLRPLVVINDGYRSTPTAKILDFLSECYPTFLNRATFLIAAGSHDAPTEEHLQTIFGRHLTNLRERVNIHASRDLSLMVSLGHDSFGSDVKINRLIMEHESVLVIGSVEPHYFAGFAGGRKSLFPGLTDQQTIERNHNLANSLDAQPLRLEGNPVALHLHELLQMVPSGKIRTIQAVLDRSSEIAGIFCGELADAFDRAVAASGKLHAHYTTEPYDAVLCEMLPPLDANLYQVQKGLENCQAAIAGGGAAIVVSACSEGVGSASFFDQAVEWDREKNESRDGIARFGSHKLSRVNGWSRRIDVRIKSELEHSTVRQVFYEPVTNIAAFLHECAGKVERNFRVAVVHDAGQTALRMKVN